MPKPICIDLFCGYGGWARGFLDAGYRVIGFDNEPKCAKYYPGEFVLADLRDFNFRMMAYGIQVIVASPPCQRFSLARPDLRNPEEGMTLVRAAVKIIHEAKPKFWCIENVRGAREAISKELGEPVRHGPWYLWGRFPGFIAPIMDKGFKHIPGERSRYLRRGSSDARKLGSIPYPLARALAEACKP